MVGGVSITDKSRIPSIDMWRVRGIGVAVKVRTSTCFFSSFKVSLTPERVIIFASSKLKVKEVAKALKQMKLNVGEMHSDLEQAQREEVMDEFKAGRINILVATDIVARGIDIDCLLYTSRCV